MMVSQGNSLKGIPVNTCLICRDPVYQPMVKKFAVFVYPNHDQFTAADQHVLAVTLHGADHFPGTGGRCYAAVQTRIHFTMFFSIFQQSMVGDIGAYPVSAQRLL